MTSSFEDLFSRFYLKAQDYTIPGLTDEVVKDMLGGYLRAVVSEPFVRRMFTSISIDEDVEEIEFEMRESTDEDSDHWFVEELLVRGMVVQWLSPRYYSTLNTSQMFTNSE